MCQQLAITSYLGVPVSAPSGSLYGTLGVIGKAPRSFTDEETDLLMVVAGLLGQRLSSVAEDFNRGTPVLALRLASEQVDQPLAIMRGYAEMLTRNEVPAEQMALVAKRLALQSEIVVRAVDEMMILARLPLQLAFTVRVSLPALLQAAVTRSRERAAAAGIELRLQIDASGDVWGDPHLLEAALDEMVNNVFQHAQGASVLQLRLRQAGHDRFHVIVKDDGQGISAERLAELFAADESRRQPARGEGLGLYLLRRVARAHGGSTWANSLEGKGATFYLELPAASPDGQAARVATSMPAPA
jgi:signal transduction histidine kinase